MTDRLPVKRTAALEPLGLVLPEGLTEREWRKHGERIVVVRHAVQWALGDWWRYGEHQYGDAVEIAAKLGLETSTLRTYARVAEAVESANRFAHLTWTHHLAVAALAPAAQRHMLQEAVDNEWSVRDLKQAIEEADKERQRANAAPAADPPEGETVMQRAVRETRERKAAEKAERDRRRAAAQAEAALAAENERARKEAEADGLTIPGQEPAPEPTMPEPAPIDERTGQMAAALIKASNLKLDGALVAYAIADPAERLKVNRWLRSFWNAFDSAAQGHTKRPRPAKKEAS